MKNILIYGTGNRYTQLIKVLNWNQIRIIAFLESTAHKDYFNGYSVYTPEKYIQREEEFDYILCASVYEQEMREHLKRLQVPEDKVVSGKMELDNYLNHPDIFDIPGIIARQNHEILIGLRKISSRNRFNDMSSGVTWMRDISLVAGGWAVGYDYMYIMLRVLQAKKPKTMLELGLGQSSKILVRYQEWTNCQYDIVEQDEQWFQFFKSESEISEAVKVYIKPVKQVYNATYGVEVNCYTDFGTVVQGNNYEFVSIDGPWGSDKISRIDILPYIPQCLEESFCIMIDDYERIGEKNMVLELEEILRKNGVEYYKTVYGEDKLFCLITSKDNSFLCSL